MGAKIKGAGTSNIEIEGVRKLKDVSYNISYRPHIKVKIVN